MLALVISFRFSLFFFCRKSRNVKLIIRKWTNTLNLQIIFFQFEKFYVIFFFEVKPKKFLEKLHTF